MFEPSVIAGAARRPRSATPRPQRAEGAAPIFITGGTGFLGSHFLSRLRKLERSTAIALVREAGCGERRARLERAVATAAASHGATGDDPAAAAVDVVQGDIEEPLCGVALQEIAALRRATVEEFWHFAACLEFSERNRARLEAQNVAGVRHAMELAAAIGARRFVYVSTAYVAGNRAGAIPERLHQLSRPFANPYEESKCRAEHEVIRHCANLGMTALILRPSIVIGPYSSKRTGGSRTGLYGFIRDLQRARAFLERSPPVRVAGAPDAEVNMIPIDWLLDDLRHVLASRSGQNSIVHLCTTSSPHVQSVLRIVCDALGLPEITVDPAGAPRSPLGERLQFYHAYAQVERRFERGRLARRTLTETELTLFVAEALREMAGRPAAPQPRCGCGAREIAAGGAG